MRNNVLIIWVNTSVNYRLFSTYIWTPSLERWINVIVGRKTTYWLIYLWHERDKHTCQPTYWVIALTLMTSNICQHNASRLRSTVSLQEGTRGVSFWYIRLLRTDQALRQISMWCIIFDMSDLALAMGI